MDLRGGAEAKIKLFQNMVMLHIKLKLKTLAANILPTDTPSTQGVGSKGQTIYFSESTDQSRYYAPIGIHESHSRCTRDAY